MSDFTSLSGWYAPLPKKGGWGSFWERPKYKTLKPLCWEIGSKGSELWVVVPEGYVFDVSIPRPLWPILSPADRRFLKAACLHDYCLHELGWGRVSSAGGFSDALRASRVGRWTRLAMVLSVIAWHWK